MADRQLQAGEVIAEKFRVEGTLGSGSIGRVYRVTGLHDGKDYALKVLRRELAVDPKNVHRVEKAVREAAAISSRHVAHVLATGCDNSLFWLQTEFAEGVTLGEFLDANHPLSLARATSVLTQLFSAVRAAHSATVSHGNLKPRNIRVSSEPSGDGDRLMVLGFGEPRTLGELGTQTTAPGHGAPLWVAPEQTLGDQPLMPPADVWTLGLLTFYVLTGRSYWRNADPSSSAVSLSYELFKAPVKPPTERVRELDLPVQLPEGFDEWFSHCVSRDPGARYAAAGAALRGLMRILDRRSHARHRLWLPVYCEGLSGGVAITHDASDNGMLVLTRSLPDQGDQLKLRFSVPPGSPNEFVVDAQVVRAGPNRADPDGLWKYQAAIEFATDAPGLSERLAQLAGEVEPAPPSSELRTPQASSGG